MLFNIQTVLKVVMNMVKLVITWQTLAAAVLISFLNALCCIVAVHA